MGGRLGVSMTPEAIWLSGFVAGLLAGIPVALLLYRLTPTIVDAVLAWAPRGRH